MRTLAPTQVDTVNSNLIQLYEINIPTLENLQTYYLSPSLHLSFPWK